MRALASIQRISKIEAIPGADRIELATVLGWHCVIQKGEFQPNDLAIYVEIDSIMPERPEFEFLRPRGFRIKTVKFSKFNVVSQGILFPMTLLASYKDLPEGTDVTDYLGIQKFEPPEPKATKKPSWRDWFMRHRWIRRLILPTRQHKTWPAWVPKTDETRIQSLGPIYERWRKEFGGSVLWIAREKLDGSSASFFVKTTRNWLGLRKRTFGVCSRNCWLKTPDNSIWWWIARNLRLASTLKHQKIDWLIQGEIIGPKVQKNHYQLSGLQFYVFNIINLTDNVQIPYQSLESVAAEISPLLKVAPAIGEVFLSELDRMIAWADGPSLINPEVHREGLVLRHPQFPAVSFKIISQDYLLSYED